MSSDWICPDCGETIPYSILDKENEDRKSKGITLMAHFVPCKGTKKHIPGVATRAYRLTEKGKIMIEETEKFRKQLQKRLDTQ